MRVGLLETVDGVGVAGGLENEGGAIEAGGRSVVAAVRAVAVLLARACPRGRGFGVVDEGNPPEEVGRGVLPEGLLLLTAVVVEACCVGTWRIDGARPKGLEGGFSGFIGLVRRVVFAADVLPEKIPVSGLPEAVVVLFTLLAALLRAAADADVVPAVVPERVKGLIWGNRLGDALPLSFLVAGASFWLGWFLDVAGWRRERARLSPVEEDMTMGRARWIVDVPNQASSNWRCRDDFLGGPLSATSLRCTRFGPANLAPEPASHLPCALTQHLT